MAKKRGNHEGSIVKRSDGRWMAEMTIGRDPTTGKLRRPYFYGKTRQQAADQLAKALDDLSRGSFVAPHKATVGQWLETWLYEYKQPKVRPLTFARVRVHGKSEDGKRTWLIFQEPKTVQSRRTIPIPTDIIEAIKRHKARQAQEKLLLGEAYEDHGLVFCCANGRPIDPVDFYRHFAHLLKVAGLPHRRFHDARHTLAMSRLS
jgi:hypothetical protein